MFYKEQWPLLVCHNDTFFCMSLVAGQMSVVHIVVLFLSQLSLCCTPAQLLVDCFQLN